MTEPVQIIVPSDEAGRKAIRDALDECSNSFTRIAAEQSLLKDIAATIKEKYEIPTAVFNKWARIHFKQNADAILQEADEICSTYEIIAGKSNQ